MTIPPAWIDQAALEAAQEIESTVQNHWPKVQRIAWLQTQIAALMMQAVRQGGSSLPNGERK